MFMHKQAIYTILILQYLAILLDLRTSYLSNQSDRVLREVYAHLQISELPFCDVIDSFTKMERRFAAEILDYEDVWSSQAWEDDAKRTMLFTFINYGAHVMKTRSEDMPAFLNSINLCEDITCLFSTDDFGEFERSALDLLSKRKPEIYEQTLEFIATLNSPWERRLRRAAGYTCAILEKTLFELAVSKKTND